MQGGTSHGSERNKGDGRAYAGRAGRGRLGKEGDRSKLRLYNGIRGQVRVLPVAAAACAAMWLGSDTPGYAMAAAILGAAYAKSTMSVFACIMLAGAAMVFGVFKEARGEETPVCVRIIAPLVAGGAALRCACK